MTSYKSNKIVSPHFTYSQIQVTFTKLFQSLSNSRNILFFWNSFLQNWDCYSLHHCWELRTKVLSSCRMQCDLLSAAKPQNARAKRYFDGFWRFDFSCKFWRFWGFFGSFWALETLRKRCPPVSASKIIMIAARSYGCRRQFNMRKKVKSASKSKRFCDWNLGKVPSKDQYSK